MRYHVLASDYDGTLAHHGKVDAETIAGIKRLLASGRRLVLVTGRELPELQEIFPELDLCDWVVAENGGLLYRPSTRESKPLADAPPERFVNLLRSRGVAPMSVGRTIVATWEPHQTTVLETIHELGLELQVIFNKGAVMVLPAGVNKASGLKAALKEMGLSPHNAVGIGDAENDHALLKFCELSVAVENALPSLKETADLVTPSDHGRGVVELIDHMVGNDLADFDPELERHHLGLGRSGEEEIKISPYGRSVLICGPSASGKSTVATRLVEAMLEQKYQFCLIDPEGDYSSFEGAMVLGGAKSPPLQEEVLRLLENPSANAVVCMTGMPISDRPAFFLSLFAELLELRSRTGRPHWLVFDEAHHLMPAEWRMPDGIMPEDLRNVVLITVHPEMLAKPLLERVTTVLAIGEAAPETLQKFASAVDQPGPDLEGLRPVSGELLLWRRDRPGRPSLVRPHPSKSTRLRHRRKYAQGELPPDRSFYFRGPENKMKLRAQNLILFLQIADGIDDDTWTWHLSQGDVSQWFRDCIKDDNLAAEAKRIEQLTNVTPQETRELIRAAVERDYTLPASSPLPVPGAS
ncbi:MAG: HAD-IIB family hydrolase [Planctomyces sp.]|nr:HAD-IIB family hydrolase [Planctomyces sp.]